MAEYISKEATEYYQRRLSRHIQRGLSLEEAEMAADFDLIEWSKPLPLPMPDESTLYELG